MKRSLIKFSFSSLKHFLSVDGSIFKSNIFNGPDGVKAPSDVGINSNMMSKKNCPSTIKFRIKNTNYFTLSN
jgi:hypothetical protein